MIRDRFKDADWFNIANDTTILVGGCGGIGSWLCFLLYRAGFSIYVMDFDIVETNNIAGQLFRMKDITKYKVDSIKDIIKDYSRENYKITASINKLDENTFTNKYCIAAFDNIKSRKIMFESWLNKQDTTRNHIFIDGRLEAEYYKIFCIRGGEENKKYHEEYLNNYLPDDSTIPEAPCTLKQTSHTAAMIAGHIVAFLTNHLTNEVIGEDIREIPYIYEYLIPINYANSKSI